MPRRKAANKVHPIERFPVKPRADGRFQKRINGVLYYFGSDGNRKLAMEEYDRVKRDLYAGRLPRAVASDASLTYKQLANRYATERLAEVSAGRLDEDWNKKCNRAIERFGNHIGSSRVIDDLRPEDFSSYGRWLSQQLGSHAYNRERESILSMFNHADECDWIERPMKFGKGFQRIAAGVIRDERPERFIESRTVVLLLATAGAQLEAMILLAINAGFGAEDCGLLPMDKINFGWGLIRNYRRPKTNIDRDVPLWPETLEALAGLRNTRPDDKLVFRTKYGNRWSGEAIAHALAKHVKMIELQCASIDEEWDLGIDITLGDLRHTFATHANELADNDAVKRIMGHKLPGLKDVYVETLFLPRLRKIVEHVRHRIFTACLESGPPAEPPHKTSAAGDS